MYANRHRFPTENKSIIIRSFAVTGFTNYGNKNYVILIKL